MSKAELKLESGFMDGASLLHCPACNQEYLHQAVIVYARMEDDDMTNKISLAILFECESCDAKPELVVGQHKGLTHIGWRW